MQILLMIVFRSVLVPLTATLGFLLSVLATLGANIKRRHRDQASDTLERLKSREH